jgi:RNA polymerase sigma-70 factor (ECF subfamily)
MSDHSPSFPQTSEQLRSFLDDHLDRLISHAFYILGNRDDAADVVQEMVVKAYRLRENLRSVRNPVAYMFKMVNNACLDLQRKNLTRVKSVSALENSLGENFSIPREEQMIREEESRWIRSLLDRLPEEQAMVIRFRFADDLGFAEIAEIVDAPVATVKSRFSYGMMKLRTLVNKQKEGTHEM